MPEGFRRRFVDSHVHLWDVRAKPWYYGFPRAGAEILGWKMTAPWQEHFLWDDYSAAVASVDLAKWVHVSAVVSAEDVESETAWVSEVAAAAGAPPFAIVGSINPNQPRAALKIDLERQMTNPAFRGLRILGAVDYESASFRHLLDLLTEHDLVYDLAADGATVAQGTGWIGAAAKCLRSHPDLKTVLEHTGMPLGMGALDEWSEEIAQLAALPNTYCKLSGLMMTIHYPNLENFRCFFNRCIEIFGTSRCLYGTNFPVDLIYGSAETHLSAFAAIADEHGSKAVEDLFAATAEKLYRF